MENLSTRLDSTEKFESREIFALAFELFKSTEKSEEALDRVNRKNLAKKLIELYYSSFETDYESMIYNFRKKYIENEARVEYNDEDNEQELIGLGYMYDHIQDFNPNEKPFDIFMEALTLHKLLYKPLDDKTKSDKEREYNELLATLEKAKENRDIIKIRETQKLIKAFGEANSSFGGNLRKTEVDLKGVEFHVPTALEALIFLNSFLNPQKKTEYQNLLSSDDLFSYIEYCVKVCVDIIKYQPFNNGNKRTARALLNLMFKNKNIPPVYIGQRERVAYKDALLKALQTGDYTDIINIYYSKICDSIYELDIKPYLELKAKHMDSPSTIMPLKEEKTDHIVEDKTIEIIDVPYQPNWVGYAAFLNEQGDEPEEPEDPTQPQAPAGLSSEDVKEYEIKRSKR